MRGAFDEPQLEAAPQRPDTELTLSSMSLFLLFFGLVALCILCFALGYSMGHHASVDPQATQVKPAATSDGVPDAHADNARSKPSADAQPGAAKQTLAQSATVQASRVAPTAPSKQWVAVKPALSDAAAPVQAARPDAYAVAPAMAATGSFMVQIAAVSNSEDADVLMSALKRRNYAVVARREPLDGLIHVRVGPFKTNDDAQRLRQKLMNDGYNAIVQP